MKELSYTNHKDIPRHVKVKNAVLIRDFSIKTKGLKCECSVEAYNEGDKLKEADTIGITMCYPNAKSPTHVSTKIVPVKIGTKEFGKQVKSLEKELLKKVN